MDVKQYKFLVSEKPFAGLYAYSASNKEIRLQPTFSDLDDTEKDYINQEAVAVREVYVRLVNEEKEAGRKPKPAELKKKAEEEGRQSIIKEIGANNDAVSIYENLSSKKTTQKKEETKSVNFKKDAFEEKSKDPVPKIASELTKSLMAEFDSFTEGMEDADIIIQESDDNTPSPKPISEVEEPAPIATNWDDDPFGNLGEEGEIELPKD